MGITRYIELRGGVFSARAHRSFTPCERPVKCANQRQRLPRVLQVAANAFGNQRRAQVRRVKNFSSALSHRQRSDIAVVRFSGAQIAEFDGEQGSAETACYREPAIDGMRMKCCGVARMPVSSHSSRSAACSSVSLASRWPAGWFQQRFAVNGFFDDEKFILEREPRRQR